MMLAKLNEPDLLFIADRMREWDRREVFATQWDDDSAKLVANILAGGEFGWVAGDGGLPIAAFGAIPVWNGVWQVWMFATDEWPKVALGVTRFIRKVMIPTLEEVGAHRAECRSMEGHAEAHRWLEVLGAHKESELPCFGRDGQTFYLYCWTKPPTKPHSQETK